MESVLRKDVYNVNNDSENIDIRDDATNSKLGTKPLPLFYRRRIEERIKNTR